MSIIHCGGTSHIKGACFYRLPEYNIVFKGEIVLLCNYFQIWLIVCACLDLEEKNIFEFIAICLFIVF